MDQSDLSKRICETIDQQYMLQILSEMVGIDSILGNEAVLAEYIADQCRKLGLKVEFDQVTSNRDNLYTTLEFSKSGKVFTFNGHFDTVEIANGWDTDPLIPVSKEGLLYGLGVADMKAGIACQLAAIKAMLEYEDELTGTLHFTGVVDEEGYGRGARTMMEHDVYRRTDAILIAEPFFGDNIQDGLPLGMTGKVLYEINVKGKSAHAFRPELGINAISDAAKIVKQIDRISSSSGHTIPGFNPVQDPQFGAGSFCVLKIEGGYEKYNVSVPDSCQIIVNRLTLPQETKEDVVEDMKSLINELGCPSEIDIVLRSPYYQGYKIEESHPLWTALLQAYTTILGQQPIPTYGKMISDANIFMGEFGIPTVNFGPKGHNLHGANENVVIDSLVPSSQVMVVSYLNFQSE